MLRVQVRCVLTDPLLGYTASASAPRTVGRVHDGVLDARMRRQSLGGVSERGGTWSGSGTRVINPPGPGKLDWARA